MKLGTKILYHNEIKTNDILKLYGKLKLLTYPHYGTKYCYY